MPPRSSVIEPRSPAIRDSLAAMYARGRIDQAWYLAGGNSSYQLADKRRAEQPGALADDQRAAWESLAKCHRALGADGSALVNDLLIRGMTAKQIAASRGLAGEERFFAKRF